MVKIDLITGFLGSGKTTFLKKYAKWLLEKGQKIGILENDFGAVNVDMLLLHELLGENCELEMIAGGCDSQTHARRFRTKLIAMGMCGYDRVLVEPSGIYDVDEFFDVQREEPLDAWYEIGNVIAVVDAKLEEDLSEEAEYLLASETANAGRIFLSHADTAAPEQIQKTVMHVNRALTQIQCKRQLVLGKELIPVNVQEISKQELEAANSCGYVLEAYRKLDMEDCKGFDSLYFMNMKMKPEALKRAAEQILQDSACGSVFRIKGFLPDGKDKWLQLNATHNGIELQEVAAGQEVLIVIGEGLCEEKIRSLLEAAAQDTAGGTDSI